MSQKASRLHGTPPVNDTTAAVAGPGTPEPAPPAGRRSPLLRGLYVLDFLSEQAATMAEIAHALGIDRSSAHRLVAKLEEGGYVEREQGGKRFVLGSAGFLRGQAQARPTVGSLPADGREVIEWSEELHQIVGQWGEAIHEIVVELRDLTSESSVFAVAARDRMVYIAFCPSVHPVRVEEYIGSTRPMHCSAVGKAYLAALAPGTLDIVLGRLSYTEGTGKSARGPFELRDKLTEIAERGYAVDRDECAVGLSCVATSVFVNGSVLVGAAGITGPSQRLSEHGITRHGELLLERAHHLKQR
jgi:DNA-binding IclR family transcriptional regulator